MFLPKPALLLVALCASACADARGRFEDYQKRLASYDAGVEDSGTDAGECVPPAPGVVGGPALLALDTSLTATFPILFLGTIDTPPLEGMTAVHYTYRALDALDRKTEVGEQLEVGPFALHEGELVAPVEKSTLDGRANPVFPGATITSEMTLRGQICGVRPYYCGTLDGFTEGLVSGPFTGHFAITLLDSADAIPDQPRYGCGPDDLAQPLGN